MLSSFTEVILKIARFENRIFLYAAIGIMVLALITLISSTTGKVREGEDAKESSK